jgi:hypothetical protein
MRPDKFGPSPRSKLSFNDLALMDSSRAIGLAGVDVTFANGLTTYVDYTGQLASGRTVNAVIGGMRYSW